MYHLAVTLNAMANPLMAFLAFFLPCRRRSVVLGLAATGCLLSGYILATAGQFNIFYGINKIFLVASINIFLCQPTAPRCWGERWRGAAARWPPGCSPGRSSHMSR